MARAAASLPSAEPVEPLLRRGRAAPGDEMAAAPDLRVVPRSRGTMGVVMLLTTILFGALLAITVFQTRLAERQLQLDRMEREVSSSRDMYDQLRQVRAQLRSPERLAAEALKLGMVTTARTEFVEVPPDVVAMVAAAGGGLDERAALPTARSLDDFRTVKSVLGVEP